MLCMKNHGSKFKTNVGSTCFLIPSHMLLVLQNVAKMLAHEYLQRNNCYNTKYCFDILLIKKCHLSKFKHLFFALCMCTEAYINDFNNFLNFIVPIIHRKTDCDITY